MESSSVKILLHEDGSVSWSGTMKDSKTITVEEPEGKTFEFMYVSRE